MAVVPSIDYYRVGDNLKLYGRPDVAATPLDTFEYNVTIPTPENTGLTSDIGDLDYEAGTSGVYTNNTDNAVFEDIHFDCRVVNNASNVQFINCAFTGTATTNTGLLYQPHVNSSSTVTRCYFKPDTPYEELNGIMGWRFKVYRSFFEHCVDNLSIIPPKSSTYWGNSGLHAVNVEAKGNYFGALAWYNDDSPVHADGTHNDHIQIHGGTNIIIEGNYFHGYKYNVLGTPALDGVKGVSSASNKHPQVGQIVLSQHSVARVEDLHVNYNWVKGGDNCFVFKTNVYATEYGNVNGLVKVTYAVEFTNNTFLNDDQRNYGGGNQIYTLRPDTLTTINGVQYTTTVVDDAFGNSFVNTSATPSNTYGSAYDGVDNATWRGDPIRVRADAA